MNILAKLYGPLMGRTLDPMNNITISVGAYGVLFCAVQGLINPGDEVIYRVNLLLLCCSKIISCHRGCRCRDRIVEGFTTTYAISAYRH